MFFIFIIYVCKLTFLALHVPKLCKSFSPDLESILCLNLIQIKVLLCADKRTLFCQLVFQKSRINFSVIFYLYSTGSMSCWSFLDNRYWSSHELLFRYIHISVGKNINRLLTWWLVLTERRHYKQLMIL